MSSSQLFSLKHIWLLHVAMAFIALAFLIPNTAVGKKQSDKDAFLPEAVSPKLSVRFYKANKQLQASKILVTADKASSPGCNNFLKKVRIFKTLQIGFQSCSIYREADCAVPSVIPFNSEKREFNSYILTEGVAWFARGENERGEDAKSWKCNQSLEEGELKFETNLAGDEVNRLEDKKQTAEERLVRAQQAYDKAKKNADKAVENKERVVAEAVRRGVIEPPKLDCKQKNTGDDANKKDVKKKNSKANKDKKNYSQYTNSEVDEEECDSLENEKEGDNSKRKKDDRNNN